MSGHLHPDVEKALLDIRFDLTPPDQPGRTPAGQPEIIYQGDYRDLVIVTLQGDVQTLEARVADLTAERDTYRDMLQASLAQQHGLIQQRDRLRGENKALRERRPAC